MKKIILPMILCLFLTACGSSNSSTTSSMANEPDLSGITNTVVETVQETKSKIENMDPEDLSWYMQNEAELDYSLYNGTYKAFRVYDNGTAIENVDATLQFNDGVVSYADSIHDTSNYINAEYTERIVAGRYYHDDYWVMEEDYEESYKFIFREGYISVDFRPELNEVLVFKKVSSEDV